MAALSGRCSDFSLPGPWPEQKQLLESPATPACREGRAGRSPFVTNTGNEFSVNHKFSIVLALSDLQHWR